MKCPNCHADNRPAAKVCAYCGTRLPISSSRKFSWANLAVGLVLILAGLLAGISGAWFMSFNSTPTPTAVALATPSTTVTLSAITPAITPTALLTATMPLVAPTISATRPISPTVAPIISPTLNAPLAERRLDPTMDRRGVVVTDMTNGRQSPLFTIPTAGAGTLLSAAWSEDGKRILVSYYWAIDDLNYGNTVQVLDEQGRKLADVVIFDVTQGGIKAAKAFRDAIWSVDGSKVAVRYQYQSDFGIWLFNSDGTSRQRLSSSEIGDWPRFVSVDKRWVIGVSSQDGRLYAESLTDIGRVAFETIKGIRMYDQRYHPWRITEDMKCDVSGAWFDGFGAYWDCH